MEQLPDVVSVYGTGIPNLTAKCIERTKRKAIYERSDDVVEVFLVKISPATEAFGKSYPEREVYPGNEDFGKTAWTYRTLEKARRRYNKI